MVSPFRNTQRRLWHLGWYICLSVSVYVAQWIGSLLLVSQKNCTPHSLDKGLSHPGRHRIDAHRSKACRRGRPRSLIWSVCTHCSRLPTVVASERFVSVWATGRNSRLFVLRENPLVSAKRMRSLGCMTSLSFAVHNALQGSQTSSHLFWLPSASVVNFEQFESAALRLVKVPLGSFPHHFKKDRPILSHKTSKEQLWYNGIYMYKTSQVDDHIQVTQILVGGLYIGDGWDMDWTLHSHHISASQRDSSSA